VSRNRRLLRLKLEDLFKYVKKRLAITRFCVVEGCIGEDNR